MIQIGEIVRIKGFKRVVGIVIKRVNAENGFTITLSSRYKPSPKSRLKNKGVFSKHKMTILKPITK